MKKKIIMSIATLTLALSMSVQAFANPLVININGVDRIFTQVIDEDGVLVVNGEELADKLSVSYLYNEMARVVTFKDSDTTLLLEIDSNIGTLNGKEVTLPTTITVVDGVVLVPLQFISDTFGATLAEENDEITTDFDELYFSDLTGVNDITADTKVYSFGKAVDLAMENNSTIKKLDVQYDETREAVESIDRIISAMQESAILYPDLVFDEEAYYDLIDTKNDLMANLDLSGDQEDLVEMSIELSLMTSLNTLDTAKMNYYLTEQSLALQEQDLDILKVKNNLGTASDYSVKKAESNLQNTKTTLATLETSIVSAKQNINNIIGLPYDDDVYIENDIQVIDKNYDVSTIVHNAKIESATVKSAKTAVDNAKVQYGSDSAQYKLAVIDFEQAKKDAEKSAYTAYNNLNMIIENDKLLHNNRDIAIADYEMALKQYELGYITQYTLDQMLLGIAKIDADILQNEMKYQLISYQLDNPELLISTTK